MAGSIKWLLYIDDAGENWAYRGDESNSEAVVTAGGGAAGVGDYGTTQTALYALPRNVRPRSALFRNASSTISRRITVPTVAVYNGLEAGDTITDQVSGETLFLVSKRGEQITIPFAADTGLIDGDNT